MDLLPPLGWELRGPQVEALEKIKSALERGVKVIALQGPTGSGKSVVGVTVASAFTSGYYLVPMRSLQDQIAADFQHLSGFSILKGKTNYPCNLYKDTLKCNVKEAPCQGKKGASLRRSCKRKKLCDYYGALEKSSKASLSLFNFQLYLCWMRICEQAQEPLFTKRQFHLIDEAHKIEEVIREHLTISISEFQLFKHLKIEKFPDLADDAKDEDYVKYFEQIAEKNDAALEYYITSYGAANVAELRVQATESDEVAEACEWNLDLKDKLDYFTTRTDNYAFGFERRWNTRMNKEIKHIVVKPLSVGQFLREQVLGETTMFMSATLPKEAVLAMGLREDEFEYIEMDSSFPKENRPIIFKPVSNFNNSNMEAFTGRVVDMVDSIMDLHPDQKGIIHCPSFKFVERFTKQMHDDTTNGERLVVQAKGEGQASALLLHATSDAPTVLVSPGMKEGVDLKNELARFQIIVKCPYPSLGDVAVKKLAEQNQVWYLTRTVIDFTQMYGRSVRTPTDWAITYILDENLKLLLMKNKNLVPGYVWEAIQW